jgi:hypothetical protein
MRRGIKCLVILDKFEKAEPAWLGLRGLGGPRRSAFAVVAILHDRIVLALAVFGGVEAVAVLVFVMLIALAAAL